MSKRNSIMFFLRVCRLMAMRWFMEDYFKLHSADYKKTIRNLVLGRLGASEVTLEMAHVCQLEPGVRQEGYSRENTEALDKATGLVARHRMRVR